MIITSGLDLKNFEFWSGAEDHEFTRSELEQLEYTIQVLYSEGITETQLNDIFQFEQEWLCECLGLDYDEYLER